MLSLGKKAGAWRLPFAKERMEPQNYGETAMMKTCVAAVAVAAACAASAANYAKLDAGGTFKFYSDEACTTEVSGTLGDDTSVMFSSDAEFQALVPYTNVIAAAGAKVALQNDVKLTAAADWRAFDFNINGKTVTLDGWDCRVGRVQGTGTFAAGNLVTNGNFEADKKNLWWNAPTGWTIAEKSRSGVLNYRANGKDNNGEYKLVSQLLNPTNDISYWAVLYTPKVSDDYTQTAAFQQTVTVSRGNWEYFVSFRYMTSGYNGSNGLVTYTPENSRIIVSLGDTRIAAQSCTTNIQTFARTLKDDNALPAGTDTLKFTLYSADAGACFDDVVVSPYSKLYFDIPAGVSYDAGNLTLKDEGLQVHKVGDGTIVFSKANNKWRVEGGQSLIVRDGIARQAAKNACGAQYAKISVSNGAQFDIYGRTSWDYDYILNGSGPDGTGVLTSTKEESKTYHSTNSGFLRNIELGSDSTLYVKKDCDWGTIFYGQRNAEGKYDSYLSATNTMNGHKLTIDGTTFDAGSTGDVGQRLYLGNMTFSGEGTIEVTSNACIQAMYNDISAAECVVDIYGMFWSQNFNSFSEVKSLKFHEGACFRELKNTTRPTTTIVRDTYAPNSAFGPRNTPNKWADRKYRYPIVQLGDAEHLDVTLDLSEWDVAFDDSAQGTLTFHDVGDEAEKEVAVTVELNQKWARRRGQPVYKWQSRPANVHFVRGESMAAADIQLYARDDGLYIVPGLSVIIR